jgi:hypothetical protein
MGSSAFNLNLSADWGMFINSGLGSADLPQNNRTGNGYALYNPTTAKMLTLTPVGGVAMPAEARHALIAVTTNPIRFRTDGTDPTGAAGLILPTGFWVFENQRAMLEQFRFIDSSAGASEVTVMYAW